MLRALEQELGTAVEHACMAGHSLGEYTALVAAGSLSQKADSAFNEDMRKALEMANGEPARKASETAEAGNQYKATDFVSKEYLGSLDLKNMEGEQVLEESSGNYHAKENVILPRIFYPLL